MSSDFRLHMAMVGEGEPIVMVHGGWTDHTTWRLVQDDLAQDHLVVAYDRRGHSQSTWPYPVPRRQDEDDLIAIIEDLDRGPAHLVGNSYGASISLAVAARRPDLVRSAAVHEPPLIGIARPGTRLADLCDRLQPLLAGVLAELKRDRRDAAVRRFVEDIALGPGAWDLLPPAIRRTMVANASTFAGMVQDPGWDQLTVAPDPSIPVLLTDGAVSPEWLPAVVEELAATHYRHAGRHTFDGAGHVPHLTHPTELAAIVRQFVGSATRMVVEVGS